MNADRGLSPSQRVVWMCRALKNYVRSPFLARRGDILHNVPVKRIMTTGLASPTRMYTENLISNFIPWKTITDELPNIFICEFGCGDLRYLDALNELLGEGNFKYIGIEAPDFKLGKAAEHKLSEKVKFINYNLNDGVPDGISECNVFLSFSVLEHIDNIDNFTQDYSSKVNGKSFHYHSVPTFLSVFNYLWHGCRHFNVFERNKLLGKFNYEKAGIVFYGGLVSLLFHTSLITSLDLISKLFVVRPRVRLVSQSWSRELVLKAQPLDDFTARIGINTFCLLFWKSN